MYTIIFIFILTNYYYMIIICLQIILKNAKKKKNVDQCGHQKHKIFKYFYFFLAIFIAIDVIFLTFRGTLQLTPPSTP
jgi:hypothetical protein